MENNCINFISKNDKNNIGNINLIESTKKNDDQFVNLKILVNSKYILKIIFSFLDKKKKLNMMKYNKSYFDLLGITIEEYKKISGKIKIDGING